MKVAYVNVEVIQYQNWTEFGFDEIDFGDKMFCCNQMNITD